LEESPLQRANVENIVDTIKGLGVLRKCGSNSMGDKVLEPWEATIARQYYLRT